MGWIIFILAIFATTVCLAACNVSGNCSREEERRETEMRKAKQKENQEEESV